MLFTYLGDTAEAYVVNKGDAVKRKWSAGILIMFILLLPLAAVFFVLSFALKRRLKKKLAAAQAAPDAAEPAPIVPDTAEPTPTETAAAEPAPTETDGAGPAQECPPPEPSAAPRRYKKTERRSVFFDALFLSFLPAHGVSKENSSYSSRVCSSLRLRYSATRFTSSARFTVI